MSSLILNLLILWLIWRLSAGQRSQRRRPETADKTVIRSKRRPVRRVRRGFTGPAYQIEDEETQTATSQKPASEAGGAFAATEELVPQQMPMSDTATVSPEQATPPELSAINQEEPLEKTASPSPDSLLAPDTLVQSLILMQALSEPRCRRAWRAR